MLVVVPHFEWGKWQSERGSLVKADHARRRSDATQRLVATLMAHRCPFLKAKVQGKDIIHSYPPLSLRRLGHSLSLVRAHKGFDLRSFLWTRRIHSCIRERRTLQSPRFKSSAVTSQLTTPTHPFATDSLLIISSHYQSPQQSAHSRQEILVELSTIQTPLDRFIGVWDEKVKEAKTILDGQDSQVDLDRWSDASLTHEKLEAEQSMLYELKGVLPSLKSKRGDYLLVDSGMLKHFSDHYTWSETRPCPSAPVTRVITQTSDNGLLFILAGILDTPYEKDESVRKTLREGFGVLYKNRPTRKERETARREEFSKSRLMARIRAQFSGEK